MSDLPPGSLDSSDQLNPTRGGGVPMSAGINGPLFQRGILDPPRHPGELGCLDRYCVLKQIGAGGMGLVFLARPPNSAAAVAIKIIKPELRENAEAVHSFLIEARHMSRLSHPHILRVFDVSDRPHGPYYVMPYMECGSLAERLTSGQPLTPALTLAVAHDIADALAYAHSRGLIHRDLKPGNVLLDADGRAYLSDFGLGRTVFNDSLADPRTTHRIGTAAYMSPAVAAGASEDTRCDIYSFGAVLYEMLAGHPAFNGASTQEVIDLVLHGPPRPILERNPAATRSLVAIAEGAMARELRDRYAKMDDVVADLDRAEKSQRPLGPHGAGMSRHTGKWITAVLIMVVTAAIGLQLRRGSSHSSELHAIARPAPTQAAAAGDSSLPPLVTSSDKEGHRVVDLLPLLDVKRDALQGDWALENGTLISGTSEQFGQIRIPFEPPKEYDFEIQFTAKKEDAGVSQILWHGGHSFTWTYGHDKNGLVAGIDSINHRSYDDRPMTIHEPHPLASGPHRSLVSVRARSISVSLDGQLLCTYPTDYSELGPGAYYVGDEVIGVGYRQTQADFHSLRITELDGAGRAVSHLPPSDDKQLRILEGVRGEIAQLRFNPDEPHVIGISPPAGTDHAIRWVWSLPDGACIHSWRIFSLDSISPDSRLAFDGEVTAETDFGRRFDPIVRFGSGVSSVAFSPDSAQVAFARNGQIDLYPVRSKTAKTIKIERTAALTNLVFSNDCRRLAGLDEKLLLHLWDCQSLQERWRTTLGWQHLLFAADDARLIGWSNDDVGSVDISTGRLIAHHPLDGLTSVQISPTGAYLLVADKSSVGLHLLDAVTLKEISRFPEGIGPVFSAAVSANGLRVLAGCMDQSVRLFDVESGRELARFKGHWKPVTCVAFSTDEKMCVSYGEDRTLRVWRLP